MTILGGCSDFKLTILLTDGFQNESTPVSAGRRSTCCARVRIFCAMESDVQRMNFWPKILNFDAFRIFQFEKN